MTKLPLFGHLLPASWVEYQNIIMEGEFYDETKDFRQQPHFLLIGKTGSGKGLKLSSLIEQAYASGYKIISIHNPGREIEHAFKKYPAEGKFAKLVRLMGEEPRGYPVKVYVPLCKGFLPQRLPDFFQLFSVPVANYPVVDSELLESITMVPLTAIGRRAIDDRLRSMKPNANVADLYLMIKEAMAGWEDLNLYFETVTKQTERSLLRLLFSLVQYRLLGHASHPLAMTNRKFTEILNRQDELSVFTQHFADPTLSPFLTLTPLRYVFFNASKCRHPILICATEIQRILRTPRRSGSYSNPAKELFTHALVDLLRSGRKHNVHFVGDSQIISELDPEFVSQASVLAFNQDFADQQDKDMLVRKLSDRSYAPELGDVLHGLSHENGKFEYYSFSKDREYRVRLPRTAHPWEGNRSDLMLFVERKEGTKNWYSTEGVFDEIEQAISETAAANYELIRGFEKEVVDEFAGIMKKGKRKKAPSKEKRRGWSRTEIQNHAPKVLRWLDEHKKSEEDELSPSIISKMGEELGLDQGLINLIIKSLHGSG